MEYSDIIFLTRTLRYKVMDDLRPIRTTRTYGPYVRVSKKCTRAYQHHHHQTLVVRLYEL